MRAVRRRFPRWTLVAVAGLCVLAVGAVGALMVEHPFEPASTRKGSAGGTIAVAPQPFTDPRPVQITLQKGPERVLHAPSSGQITALACSVGAVIASGSSPLSVDGEPRLGLATTVPLWRDLPRSARGPDVVALQAALLALKFDVRADGGAVGDRTLAAVAAALRKVGNTTRVREVIPVAEIVWIPDTTAPVTACTGTVGQLVSVGDTLASFAPALAGARITKMPEHLIPGGRALRVGAAPINVSATGAITSADAIRALAATPEYAAAASDSSSSGIPATYELESPVDVSVVPPSAVAGAAGAQCVVTPSRRIGVEVVGSQLGRTYVTFAGDAPSSVLISAPAGTRCG